MRDADFRSWVSSFNLLRMNTKPRKDNVETNFLYWANISSDLEDQEPVSKVFNKARRPMIRHYYCAVNDPLFTEPTDRPTPWGRQRKTRASENRMGSDERRISFAGVVTLCVNHVLFLKGGLSSSSPFRLSARLWVSLKKITPERKIHARNND